MMVLRKVLNSWCHLYLCKYTNIFICPLINPACKNEHSSSFSASHHFYHNSFFCFVLLLYIRLSGYVCFFQIQTKKTWLYSCQRNIHIIITHPTVIYQMNSEAKSTAVVISLRETFHHKHKTFMFQYVPFM